MDRSKALSRNPLLRIFYRWRSLPPSPSPPSLPPHPPMPLHECPDTLEVRLFLLLFLLLLRRQPPSEGREFSRFPLLALRRPSGCSGSCSSRCHERREDIQPLA